MSEQVRRLKLPYFRVELGFLGEDWQECWVEFSEMSWEQRKALYAKTLDLDEVADETLSNEERLARERAANEQAEAEIVKVVQDAFIQGKSLDTTGAVIDLKAGDFTFANFTSEAIMRFYNQIAGVPDPKASMTSPATTPEQDASPSNTSSSDTESASA